MYGYIYVTTNNINGKKYLGQTKYEKINRYYLGSGKHLKKAIKKYGRENFSIKVLEECNTQEELNQKEIDYISKFDCVNSREWYNIANGGYSTRGFTGKSHTLKTKQKMSLSYKRELTETGRRNIGEACKRDARHLNATNSRTQETFNKISNTRKGLKTLIKDGKRKYAHPGSEKWNTLIKQSWVPLSDV